MPDVIRSARHSYGLPHLPTYIAVVVHLFFSIYLSNMYVQYKTKRSKQ